MNAGTWGTGQAVRTLLGALIFPPLPFANILAVTRFRHQVGSEELALTQSVGKGRRFERVRIGGLEGGSQVEGASQVIVIASPAHGPNKGEQSHRERSLRGRRLRLRWGRRTD